MTAGLKDLASDVHAYELASAVRRRDSAAVEEWGKLCAKCDNGLDARASKHVFGGQFALTAPPIWLAAYKGDVAMVEALLKAGASADAKASTCGGRRCAVGGQSALHLAVSRGALDCVQRLCNLRAQPDAPLCFPLASEDDEPQYDEDTDSFDSGLVGLSVLQLAALRSPDAALCSLLLAHGADASCLVAMPPALMRSRGQAGMSLAPQLKPLSGEDGEPLDCPICLQPVLALTAQWTPCCVRGFHSHCLRGLGTCPMCRHQLPSAQAASSVLTVQDPTQSSATVLEVSMRSTAAENRAAALALSFNSAAFQRLNQADDSDPRIHDNPTGNYGWRVGGQFIYTV